MLRNAPSQTLYHRKANSARARRKQLQEIDEIVALLQNGQWHPLDDLITKTKLPKAQTHRILQFLTAYNLITLDRQQRQAKITPSLLKFLTENQTC